jgi:hypothetical protein
MRIAQIARLRERIPLSAYGSAERITSLSTDRYTSCPTQFSPP